MKLYRDITYRYKTYRSYRSYKLIDIRTYRDINSIEIYIKLYRDVKLKCEYSIIGVLKMLFMSRSWF